MTESTFLVKLVVQKMFTVLSFGQVTKVFGLLYSVMFTGLIRSSFFGHLNNPLYEQDEIFNENNLALRMKKIKKNISSSYPNGSSMYQTSVRNQSLLSEITFFVKL